jgi:hypothetical protein
MVVSDPNFCGILFFFFCWTKKLTFSRWDNVVYLTFALSALLLEAAKPGASIMSKMESLKHIEQCVLLFDAMNDCDVSRNLRDLAAESVVHLKVQTSQTHHLSRLADVELDHYSDPGSSALSSR